MRMIVVMDDLDHTREATETVELTFDGVTYTLDLCEKNAERLRETLTPWFHAAHDRTRVKRTRASVSKPAPGHPMRGTGVGAGKGVIARVPNPDLRGEIRDWARERGMLKGGRGGAQLSHAILDAWEAEHGQLEEVS